jgi:hypothetical protein
MPAVSRQLHAPKGNRQAPIIGAPAEGSVLTTPTIEIAWLPPATSNGIRPVYQVEIIDRASGRPVATARTSRCFSRLRLDRDGKWEIHLTARLNATGSVTAAIPTRFESRGIATPRILKPEHSELLPAGDIDLRWTVVPSANAYQYIITSDGSSRPVTSAITTRDHVTIQLLPKGAQPIAYRAAVRACTQVDGCDAAADLGWGPWSLQATTGDHPFHVAPRPPGTSPPLEDPGT